jgi:hypothetical protein
MAINLTQIDFNRPPQDWSRELFDLLVAMAREVNTLADKLDEMETTINLHLKVIEKLGKQI